ncbi:STYKc [Musa troglodytarum]|uniref:STYKc n=1 Tax=Musa troglodytarum TaxID=320322 RepID=A0A9E7JLK7_9LILI|nr:STYKc [Musa troglodytarum]
MKEGGGDGFVRADQIDLKSLDEQLERHLSRAWTMEKRKEEERRERRREEWEIDPSKLLIKGVIARGTFGTVHRGVYDGQDVAVKLLDWGEEGNRTEAEVAALRAAFSQEVSVWHKLDHPNVTTSCGRYAFLPKPNGYGAGRTFSPSPTATVLVGPQLIILKFAELAARDTTLLPELSGKCHENLLGCKP